MAEQRLTSAACGAARSAPSLVARLAREAFDKMESPWSYDGDAERDIARIADALRAALTEAARVARTRADRLGPVAHDSEWERGHRDAAEAIATTIEALKGDG